MTEVCKVKNRNLIVAALFALLALAGVAAAQGPGWADALAEVNATRAQRGLYPFVRDDGLTAAAGSAATYRAAHGIEGHTANDFAALPPGVRADAAGCAAWAQGSGWGACCTYDAGPTHAGAAAAVGPDGRRYMHLFVRRGGPAASVITATSPVAASSSCNCPAGVCAAGGCPAGCAAGSCSLCSVPTAGAATCGTCGQQGGQQGGQVVAVYERRPVVQILGRVLHPFARLRGRFGCR
jgi:hypothetical protein